MINFEIPGTIRIKKNSRRLFKMKNSKRIMNLPSLAYIKWEKFARFTIMNEIHNKNNGYSSPLPLQSTIRVQAMCYYKGQKPDLSGVLESVGDCCEGILWENDKQIVSWDGSRLIHDLKNPRTIISFCEMEV